MALRPTQRLIIGDEAPDFSLPATGKTAGRGQRRTIVTLSSFRGKKNVVLVFFPAAFTPICTAQLPTYEENFSEFKNLNAQILGISTDNVFSIEGWCHTLGGLSYPVLSDFWPHGFTAIKYGILRSEGIAERAIFVIDKEGKIRYIDIHDINEEPPVEPVMEALAHLH